MKGEGSQKVSDDACFCSIAGCFPDGLKVIPEEKEITITELGRRAHAVMKDIEETGAIYVVTKGGKKYGIFASFDV